MTDTPQSGHGGPGKNPDGVGITVADPAETTPEKHADGVGITRANDGEESTGTTDD